MKIQESHILPFAGVLMHVTTCGKVFTPDPDGGLFQIDSTHFEKLDTEVRYNIGGIEGFYDYTVPRLTIMSGDYYAYRYFTKEEKKEIENFITKNSKQEIMNYINLTPHTINLLDPKTKETLAYFESQGSVRVGMDNKITIQNGVPVGETKYNELEGLPDPKEGVVYILSNISFNAAKDQGRKDICYPSGQMFRDDKGKIIGMEFLSF